jgi:GntR family transcriptional regulator, gluconate operon transcriptional repressor
MREAAARGDAIRFSELDLGFHDRLCALSGNRRLHRAFANLAGVLGALLRLEVTTQYESLDHILAVHETLLADLSSRDVARAEAGCRAHLGEALERVIRMTTSARAARTEETT